MNNINLTAANAKMRELMPTDWEQEPWPLAFVELIIAAAFSSCTSCGGSGRWPTRLIKGQECICHLGHGEQDCQAHVDWDICSDCQS